MKVVLDSNGKPIFPPGTSDAVKAEVIKALNDLDAGNFEEVNVEDLD